MKLHFLALRYTMITRLKKRGKKIGTLFFASKRKKERMGKILAVAVVVLSLAAVYLERHPMGRTFPLLNVLRPDYYAHNQIPNLAGKVMIVTGGTTGLGLASVRELYRNNAHVILTARSVSKGEAAKAAIEKEIGETRGKIEVMELELSSLANVRSFADAFKAKKLPLHVLMLNAGMMMSPYQLSKDGIEMQFAVNHVAHQLLTELLLDVLKKSAPSRVVSLSSAAHGHAPSYGVGLSLDTINDEKNYSPMGWYGQSKLANIFFARELSEKLKKQGIFNVYVNAVHPGFVNTELARYVTDSLPPFLGKVVSSIALTLGYSPEKAALTQLYVATSPEIEAKNLSGEYFVPIAAHETQYLHDKIHDADLQHKLWAFTQELTKSSE